MKCSAIAHVKETQPTMSERRATMKVLNDDLRFDSSSSLNDTKSSEKAGSSSRVLNSRSGRSSRSGFMGKLRSGLSKDGLNADFMTLTMASVGLLFSFIAFLLMLFK